MHPIRGFPGVAESVVGSVAEHDAAGSIFRERSVASQQLVAVHSLVDPEMKSFLALPAASSSSPASRRSRPPVTTTIASVVADGSMRG